MSAILNFSRRGFSDRQRRPGSGVCGDRKIAARRPANRNPSPNLFAPPPGGKPNAYIHIGTDESVTFLIPKGGDGPRSGTTACSQMLAEELECDWARVRMEIAPVDPASYGPFRPPSVARAIRSTWEPLRKAGAESSGDVGGSRRAALGRRANHNAARRMDSSLTPPPTPS